MKEKKAAKLSDDMKWKFSEILKRFTVKYMPYAKYYEAY